MQTGFVQLLMRGTEIQPKGEDMSRTALEVHQNRILGYRPTTLAREPTLASRALEKRNVLRKKRRAGVGGPQARVVKGRT